MTDELVIPVPPDAGNPIEMARIWIDGKGGGSHISLNYGLFDENELYVWGSLAADLIAQAVNAYLLNGGEGTSEAAFAAVERGVRERLVKNPVKAGAFIGTILS